MDKSSQNGETLFSKAVGIYIPQKRLKNLFHSKSSPDGEKHKNCSTSQAKLMTFLKRVHERRKKNGVKNESTGDNPDSCDLEALHVRRVYDQIAPHIQDLKQRTWPRVKDFLKALPAGSLVADVGCGNGHYFHINPLVVKIGSDICLPFLNFASLKGLEVICADNLQLPYRDNCFDAAISVGVIHHFATQERRVQALCELARIVQPGGRIMVYVWAFEQRYRKFDSQDILVPWHKPRKSESGHWRQRVSSLSDSDRLSTSSTGSSVSDEESSPCHQCQLQNLQTYYSDGHLNTDSYTSRHLTPDLYTNGAATPSELESHTAKKVSLSLSRRQDSQQGEADIAKGKVKVQSAGKGCSTSGKKHRCRGSSSNLYHLEQKLAKGEALIRECQKVESCLSTLSKTYWESLPLKSGSLESVSSVWSSDNNPNEYHSGSFEEQDILASIDQSSPNDDDVFETDKAGQIDGSSIVSPEMVKAEQVETCCNYALGSQSSCLASRENIELCPSQASKKLERQEDAFSSSAALGPRQSQEEELNSGRQMRPQSYPPLLQFAEKVSMKSLKVEEEMHQRNETQKQLNGTSSHCSKAVAEFLNLNSLQEGKHRKNDYQDVDSDVNKKSSHSQAFLDRTQSSPRNMLNVLKEGIRNIFTSAKQDNGREYTPCFAPCLSQFIPQERFIPQEHFIPQEDFQIREFPQSSLPSGADSLHLSRDNTHPETEESCSSTGLVCNIPPVTDVIPPVTYQKSYSSKQSTVKIPSATNTHQYSTNYDTTSKKTVMGTKEENTDTRSTSVTEETPSCTEPKFPLPHIPPQREDRVNTDLCRFYHVFREGELVSLVMQHVAGVRVVGSFYDHSNWCLIMEKM